LRAPWCKSGWVGSQKNTGDGLLAEFRSAVEAVRAATQFQERVHDLTIGDAEDKRLAFRVGISDGVNIAARLEGIAEPGGICISSSAYDQVLGKVEVEFADLGELSLKNITRPMRAYGRSARSVKGDRRREKEQCPALQAAS
jgi:class 3 adenylate cyclase